MLLTDESPGSCEVLQQLEPRLTRRFRTRTTETMSLDQPSSWKLHGAHAVLTHEQHEHAKDSIVLENKKCCLKATDY